MQSLSHSDERGCRNVLLGVAYGVEEEEEEEVLSVSQAIMLSRAWVGI